ncbi:MAG TPA: hypothetical protein VGM10_03205 [Actinocrinis sp.]|jgi:hypothetical protein
MQSGALPTRRACIAALGAVALAAGLAACGSSGSGDEQPAGLSGQQAQSYDSSQYGAEDKAAASVLAPRAGSFLAGKGTVGVLGSTTPANGDENPYAIWPVTRTVGSVSAGDVLVDNFNNQSNDQGTGTTIVDVHPGGQVSVFADLPATVSGCPGEVGLTGAMVQLQNGWVIVGSLPSTDGKIGTAGAGCLLEISPTGQLGGTISGSYLNGPWSAAVQDDGTSANLFVTNTLVGLAKTATASANQGTVVRIALSEPVSGAPAVTGETQIAGGFAEKGDAAAFVKGPTGLAFDPSSGTLYATDNIGNRIVSIPQAATRTGSAGTGTVLTQGGQLANPLGITVAPDGDLLAANATNGKIVEVTTSGQQVGEYYAIQDVGQDPAGNGDLFDLAINQAGTGVLFVKDDTNSLAVLSAAAAQ